MSKRSYDEVSVLRILSKNKSIEISGKGIYVNTSNNNIGNGTWGKIDYLCKIHNYHYVISSDGKSNNGVKRKQHSNNVKVEAKIPMPVNTLNMSALSIKAMKNVIV